MEGIYTCFLPRRLGVDIVNNLVLLLSVRPDLTGNPQNVYPRQQNPSLGEMSYALYRLVTSMPPQSETTPDLSLLRHRTHFHGRVHMPLQKQLRPTSLCKSSSFPSSLHMYDSKDLINYVRYRSW